MTPLIDREVGFWHKASYSQRKTPLLTDGEGHGILTRYSGKAAMTDYWWKDLVDRNNQWQGLELTVKENQRTEPAMEMLSGHFGRMALQLAGEPLFWASMLEDHSGVWLVFNADHPRSQEILPAVTSEDIERIKAKGEQVRIGEWCRYFVRQLMNAPTPLLSPQRWLIRPMLPIQCSSRYSSPQPIALENWRFSAPESTENINCQWTLYGEDFPDLTQPENVRLVDWWWGGYLLRGRYAIQPNTGRVKWWRKKCREGTLPPILVWYIAGLGSYVILDGHYRLQAAIEEQIPPLFLVLSELNETEYPADAAHQARIVQSLEKQLANNPNYSVNAVNQTLISLYDRRYLYASTHSRVTLGEGTQWATEVERYLQKHHLDAYRDKIFQRVKGD